MENKIYSHMKQLQKDKALVYVYMQDNLMNHPESIHNSKITDKHRMCLK